MVEHTQTIRWPWNCLSMFGYFVGLLLKGLMYKISSEGNVLTSKKYDTIFCKM